MSYNRLLIFTILFLFSISVLSAQYTGMGNPTQNIGMRMQFMQMRMQMMQQQMQMMQMRNQMMMARQGAMSGGMMGK
ncbi:unnamed protein product, partial [Mesorhabditis belari]|uniref:Uncharacterized protein n=1 Tax=Mesorhabditis belari TaxID=2138241 RepID=A0AAF3EP21_9BILA